MSNRRVASILWMCCAQFFVAEQIAASAWSLPYDFATNYISDLGRTDCNPTVCSPWHAVMNLSFVLQGVLIAAGASLFSHRPSGTRKIATILLMICGAGTVIVGLAPSNSNGPVHVAGAVLYLLGGGLGMIVTGLSLQKPSGWALVTMGLVVVSATCLLANPSGAIPQVFGVGTVERVAVYAINACLIWRGAAGLWSNRDAHTPRV